MDNAGPTLQSVTAEHCESFCDLCGWTTCPGDCEDPCGYCDGTIGKHDRGCEADDGSRVPDDTRTTYTRGVR